MVVTLSPAVDAGTLTFREGTRLSPKPVLLPAPGIIEDYPFDSYRVLTEIEVVRPDSADAPGRSTEVTAIPSKPYLSVNAPGWSETELERSPRALAEEEIAFRLIRSTPTITIALIFVALMAAVAVLAVLLVIATVRERFELSMATAAWMTAALFALITLRTRMPGTPPLGSWIDILVYIWVVVMLALAFSAIIVMLLSQGNRTTNPPSQPVHREADG